MFLIIRAWQVYFLAVISPRLTFLKGCPRMLIRPPPWLRLECSRKYASFTSTTKKRKICGKARRIRIFQDLQKNSPPNRKAYVVWNVVPFDSNRKLISQQTTKAHLHIYLKSPKPFNLLAFPRQQRHGFNMRWKLIFILHGKSNFSNSVAE